MATEINAGRVAMVPKGEWSASTAYVRLDVVSYHGSSYVCKQDGTGQTPDTATNYWQLLSSGLDPTVDTIAAKHYEGSTLTAETSISAAGVISKTASGVTKTFNLPADSGTLATASQVAAKQDALVSGTNIKTINNESILGSGDITIQGGGEEFVTLDIGFGQCMTTDGISAEDYGKIEAAMSASSMPMVRDSLGTSMLLTAGENTGEYKLTGFGDNGEVRVVTIGDGVMGSEYEVLDVKALPIEQFVESDPTVPSYVKSITQANITAWNAKQDTLVSGTNIKTVNSTSLLGSGDIVIPAGATGPQGPQGNSGYTGAAGELEVVNNLTDGGATAALSAEMGKELVARDNRIVLVGQGDTAVTVQLKGLLEGRIYRFIFEKVWDISGLTVSDTYNTLIIGSFSVLKKNHDQRVLVNDYTVPTNSSYVELTIRATSGEVVRANIEDVTADYDTATRGFAQRVIGKEYFIYNGYFGNNGVVSYGNDGISVMGTYYLGVVPNNTYTIDNPSNYLIGYCTYTKDKTLIARNWFTTLTSITIPSNCHFIRLMLRDSNGLTVSTMSSYIVLKYAMPIDDSPTASSANPVTSGGVFAALEGKQDKYKEEDVTSTIANTDGRWIQYSSGKSIATSSGLKVFYMRTDGLFSVQCTVGLGDAYPSAIAFYSSDNFDPTNQFPSGHGDIDGQGGYKDRYYMKSDSVQAASGTNTYAAVVPNGAKWVAFTNRAASLANPIFKVYKSTDTSEEIARVESIADKGVSIASNALNPFINAPHYYHFRPNNFFYSPDKSIASESLEDIGIAARLGFKFIEANIHQTSDGKFIVIHGESGKLGQEVKSTNESVITTDNLRNSDISSLTLDYIKTYAVYDSSIAKYQTTVPSLEEFCQACKTHNIGIFAGTNVKEAVEICVKYLGSNVIVYNPPAGIRDYFDGFVFKWTDSSSITPASELDTARSYGSPYLLGLGSTALSTLNTNQTLDTLIEDMHDEGFLVGCSGVYDTEANVRDCLKRGMDFNGSGWEVNPFEHNFEIFDIDDANALPTTTGTISNGVVTLAANDTLTCGSETAISLGKCCLMITFDGELTIAFGHYDNQNVHGTVSSDGAEMLIMTDYVMNKSAKLTITATASTTITGFVYKTSKC